MEALEGAATGALEFLLPKLANMLADEYNLHRGVKEGVRYIRRELESMQVALEKVSQVSSDRLDPQVKLWARQLRDMSYKIEDTVDSYMVTVDPSADDESESCTTICCSVSDSRGMLPRTFMARRNIATEIERIKREVNEMAELRRRNNVDGITAPPPERETSDPRLPDLYQDPAKIVGIDHSTKHIIELLSMQVDQALTVSIVRSNPTVWSGMMPVRGLPAVIVKGLATTATFFSNSKGSTSKEEKKILPRLVSIVGPGGIGKTTLANAVYRELKDDYDCTAFVSVSPKPNIKNILGIILREVDSGTNVVSNKAKTKTKTKSILRQESHRNHGNTDYLSEKEIIDRIIKILANKRYLIVIDDLWNGSAWKHLKCVLVPNRFDSKIITTTRNITVAKLCSSCDNVNGTTHQVEPLSGDESEKLFYCKVFGIDKCRSGFEDISRKILGKCKGLPLAIVSMAGLLANKAKYQWVHIYDTRLQNIPDLDVMWSILFLSYCDMPCQLRACFLYLSMFPEDHVIGRDDLIWRWIAEGFVHGKQDGDISSLYEVGDEYFNELINRNMIQPAQVDTLGRAHACTVHDIVLEYTNQLSNEEGFVTILDGRPFPSPQDNIHRLSLQNSEEEHGVPKAVKRLPHVRTLVVSSLAATSMPPMSIFPVMRVLDLEGCTSHTIKDVGFLVLLRYLKLSQAYYGSHHIELPQGIGALKLLEILDLKDAAIQGLPATLVQLRHLRVLKLSLYSWDKRYEKHLIQCLCNLEKLENLYISAANVSLDFMLSVDWATPLLRRFTTCFHEQNEHILKPGSVWGELSSFSTLPSWINSSLSCLSDLSIMVGKLQQRDVDILAQFPILVTLDLEVVQACEEGRLVISDDKRAFQHLSNLKFASRALGLVFTPGAMRELHELYLCFSVAHTKDVHELNDKDHFHIGLENLTSLKAVEVEIDCRCAWPGELEAAEDALRTTANLNPNQPAFVVRRYFEKEIMSEAVFSEHEGSTRGAGLSRVGPWGGNGRMRGDGGMHAYGIRVPPHRLETVIIRSGDVIDQLAFSYTDHDGKQYNAGPWGGSGGNVYTIHLGPSEYLTQVSGSTGTIWGLNNIVNSLTFVTNVASYGPYGHKQGKNQFVVQARRNSCIIGFFATAEKFVSSVGFYTRPL